MFEDSSTSTSNGKARQFVDTVVIIACGLTTTVLVAAMLAYMQAHWYLALYCWRLFGFIPIGALLCGSLAASGYVHGAKLRGVRPRGGVFICIGVAAVVAYFLMHYLSYSMLGGEGDLIRFSRYLQLMNDNSALNISWMRAAESPYTPGPFSIVWGGLEVLLFALAGWAVFWPKK